MATIPDLQARLAYSILQNKIAAPDTKINIVAIAIFWLRYTEEEEKAKSLHDKAVEMLGEDCLEPISSIHQTLADSLRNLLSGKKRETIFLGKR